MVGTKLMNDRSKYNSPILYILANFIGDYG